MAKASAIAVVLLMTSIALVQAQPSYLGPQGYGYYIGTNLRDNGGLTTIPVGVTPDKTVTTSAFLSFRPNPVGVGQTILVNMWCDPGPSVTRYFRDYKVTFTKPDGTTEVKTLYSYQADSTAWFEYVVARSVHGRSSSTFLESSSQQATTRWLPEHVLQVSPKIIQNQFTTTQLQLSSEH